MQSESAKCEKSVCKRTEGALSGTHHVLALSQNAFHHLLPVCQQTGAALLIAPRGLELAHVLVNEDAGVICLEIHSYQQAL